MFPTYVYIPSVALLDGEKGGGGRSSDDVVPQHRCIVVTTY